MFCKIDNGVQFFGLFVYEVDFLYLIYGIVRLFVEFNENVRGKKYWRQRRNKWIKRKCFFSFKYIEMFINKIEKFFFGNEYEILVV